MTKLIDAATLQLFSYGSYFSPVPNTPDITVGTVSALVSATQSATEGQTIGILPGIYTLTSALNFAADNVTLRSTTGVREDVIIQGNGMDNASYDTPNGFYLTSSTPTIRDVTIQNFYWHGVTFGAGGHTPRLLNVHFKDIGTQFVKASQLTPRVDNGIVLGCRFEFTSGRPTTNHDGAGYYYNGFIDAHTVTNWLVKSNLFLEGTITQAEIDYVNTNDPGAPINRWSPGIYFWNRSVGTVVEDNVFINCARAVALGLIHQNDGTYDHEDGIIRNNMATITPGRLSLSQTEDSDGVFLLWDSLNAEVCHNTTLTNGQVTNSVQARWRNITANNNLSDIVQGVRDNAAITGDFNVTVAASTWFEDPAQGDLHLSITGAGEVLSVPRLNLCLLDIDGENRPLSTRIGADHIPSGE